MPTTAGLFMTCLYPNITWKNQDFNVDSSLTSRIQDIIVPQYHPSGNDNMEQVATLQFIAINNDGTSGQLCHGVLTSKHTTIQSAGICEGDSSKDTYK